MKAADASDLRRKLLAIAVRLMEDLPTLPVRVIAREVRIHESCIYKAWKERHPGPFGRRPRADSDYASAEFKALCDTMLDVFREAALRRVVIDERDSAAQMTASEVFEATELEYGPVSKSGMTSARERRLYRALKLLLNAGLVEVAEGKRPRLYKLAGAR